MCGLDLLQFGLSAANDDLLSSGRSFDSQFGLSDGPDLLQLATATRLGDCSSTDAASAASATAVTANSALVAIAPKTAKRQSRYVTYYDGYRKRRRTKNRGTGGSMIRSPEVYRSPVARLACKQQYDNELKKVGCFSCEKRADNDCAGCSTGMCREHARRCTRGGQCENRLCSWCCCPVHPPSLPEDRKTGEKCVTYGPV